MTRAPRRRAIRAAMTNVLAVLLACACSGAAPMPGGPAWRAAAAIPVEVVRVLDGDTLDVRIAGVEDRVRVIGIDAPERPHGDRPAEPLAGEATRAAREALAGGVVTLVRDRLADDRDRHGRLLRHVTLEDGSSLAERLLRDGLGVAMTRWPHERADAHVTAETEAIASGRGVWSRDVLLELSWAEAPEHVGRTVVVDGVVVTARCLDGPCFLNFHRDDRELLSGVVLKVDRRRFPPGLDRLYEGRRVRITGQVTLYRDRPQILIHAPERIRVLDAPDE